MAKLSKVEVNKKWQKYMEKFFIKEDKSTLRVEIDLEYYKEIIKSGAYVEFDNFGKEYFIDKRYRGFAGGVFARDIERVRAVKELIDLGYLSNILITCDVCLKTLLHRYGGWGYDHILTNIVPMMREEGITEKQIDILLKENPRRFLDIGTWWKD